MNHKKELLWSLWVLIGSSLGPGGLRFGALDMHGVGGSGLLLKGS